MREYINRCGRIARMFSIGHSVEGRPLWALEISKTPGKVEPKPNARIIGNMHGDEPASRCTAVTLCILCTKYFEGCDAFLVQARLSRCKLSLLSLLPERYTVDIAANVNRCTSWPYCVSSCLMPPLNTLATYQLRISDRPMEKEKKILRR